VAALVKEEADGHEGGRCRQQDVDAVFLQGGEVAGGEFEVGGALGPGRVLHEPHGALQRTRNLVAHQPLQLRGAPLKTATNYTTHL